MGKICHLGFSQGFFFNTELLSNISFFPNFRLILLNLSKFIEPLALWAIQESKCVWSIVLTP